MSQEKLSGVRLYERYIKALGAIKEKNLHIPRFISQSNDTLRLIGTIFRLAQADASVLLLGESGSGKSYMARYIHENGPRRDLPFIAVNCASIPGELLESEFFGYDGGAFTGARRQGNTGFVELAGRGTLFLDEIAELSLPMQAKLLQVLQDGSYFKIGGSRCSAGSSRRPTRTSTSSLTKKNSAKTSTTASASSRSASRRCASATKRSYRWPSIS